jgi:hypothetical protein
VAGETFDARAREGFPVPKLAPRNPIEFSVDLLKPKPASKAGFRLIGETEFEPATAAGVKTESAELPSAARRSAESMHLVRCHMAALPQKSTGRRLARRTEPGSGKLLGDDTALLVERPPTRPGLRTLDDVG